MSQIIDMPVMQGKTIRSVEQWVSIREGSPVIALVCHFTDGTSLDINAHTLGDGTAALLIEQY